VSVAAAVMAIVGSACNGSNDPPPAKINLLKAYYCAAPSARDCASRGGEIPAGTLPPTNEAFQVWAFYQGWLLTHWRMEYGTDSAVIDRFTPDSAHVWLNLNGDKGPLAPSYTLHVFIRGASGFITNDSLRWNYPQ
jgi:hypothetical protein